MSELLRQPGVMEAIIFIGILIVFGLIYLAMGDASSKRIQKRVERIRNRKQGVVSQASKDQSSLRRKVEDNSMPLLGKLVRKLPNLSLLRARLERAGVQTSAEKYVMCCIGATAVITMIVAVFLGRPLMLGLFAGIILGIGIPHWVVGFKASSRMKQFLRLFPDAIDLIVRGLRSGLPVTESINMVARELEDPIRSIFHGIGESVRLGVTLEKTLLETAKRLGNTEFNFFATSIILQRETGGNLSEVLSNLGEVLRTRYMMRMKIKALSSEARASAYIVGALPFAVVGVLTVLQPDYLRPLFDDYRGNIALLGACTSMGTGIFIMMKMTRFEI
jgi:tight adherence protein B